MPKDSPKKQPTSPYKKFKDRNTGYSGYVNMYALTPHKPYKMLKITPTSHEKYGAGQLVQVTDPTRMWKVQLPGKYLASLSIPEDIDVLKQDMQNRKNPYLIYRETMADRSYRIDIVPDSPDMRSKFEKWEDVDELGEDPIEE